MTTIKSLFSVIVIILITAVGCSPEKDITNPTLATVLLSEDFSVGAVDNAVLNTAGWVNVAETGTTKWKYQIYSGNAYAEFTSYSSPDPVCVSWLISPNVDLDRGENEKLVFEAAQSYVTSSANSLEVFISTNFTGTNVATANWQPLQAILPTTSSSYFQFIKSGVIDLSGFSGRVNIGFKVKGSGTNTSLDGSYQIDNVRVYY